MSHHMFYKREYKSEMLRNEKSVMNELFIYSIRWGECVDNKKQLNFFFSFRLIHFEKRLS